MSKSLLLIDDHPLFVDGFAAMLWQFRPEWRLRAANSAAAGLALVTAAIDIDLAIIDIQLPDLDGFATVAAVRAVRPGLACVIISGRDDNAAHARAMACGSSGFIGKTDMPEAIIAALDDVLAGGQSFAPDRMPAVPAPILSGRQAEVLALLAQGHANKEIRYRLGIAERTVRAHLTELFTHLGATSRVQAIVKARQLGLID